MKTYACIYTLLAAMTMILGAVISSDVLAEAEPVKVDIKGYKFGPKEVTVKPGQAVTWKNLDSASHTVLVDGKESRRMMKGADFKHMFSTPGSYPYQCGLHSSMKGVINVVGADGAKGSAAHAGHSAGMAMSAAAAPKKAAATEKMPHADPTEKAGNVVSIVDFMRFTPAVLTVKAGTTVVFENHDGSNHIVLIGTVRSPRLRHDSSWSYKFDKPGEYGYICSIHGDRMSGKIIVI